MKDGQQPHSTARAPLAPLSRQSLHAQVVDRLRDLITEGALPPGEKLNELQLCTELGVSRTPFREALKTLAGEGLVVTQSGRSATVRRYAPDEVLGMLEVMAEIEALGGRLACERADHDKLAVIRAAHAEMLDLYERRERLAYYKMNQAIHGMIAAASGNTTLVELHGNLQARMKRIRFIGHNAPENWSDAVAEHVEMDEALSRRDGAAMAQVLRRHLLNTWQRVADAI